MSSLCRTRPWHLVFAGLLIFALAGCGHEPVRRVPAAEGRDVPRTSHPVSAAERAAQVAYRQLGVPYRYGGHSPDGFDCSGLTRYVWQRAGVKIPRTTADQWSGLSPVSGRALQRGDVLFFRIDGRISHVGLYVGERRFIHAPSTGRVVSLESLDSSFYRNAFVRGGRP